MHACEPCHDGTELRSFMLPSGITRTIVSNITPSQESHALVTGPKDSSLTGSCQQSAARADSVRAHRIEPECFRPMVYIALAFLAVESPTTKAGRKTRDSLARSARLISGSARIG